MLTPLQLAKIKKKKDGAKRELIDRAEAERRRREEEDAANGKSDRFLKFSIKSFKCSIFMKF